jgi:uncharacterized protein (UPF0264 family)
MKLLVSVRDTAEALAAAAAGAGVVDFKNPAHGALGAWPVDAVAAAVRALRGAHPLLPTSATIGDQPAQDPAQVLPLVQRMAATGVGVVKVGVLPGPAAGPLLAALAGCGWPVVPLFLADAGVPVAALQQALAAPRGVFPVLMLDTEAKHQGSLLQRLPAAALRRFVAAVQASGRQAGLAGALRAADVPGLRGLGADIAGFRSAVCAGPRDSALDPARVALLGEALRSVD